MDSRPLPARSALGAIDKSRRLRILASSAITAMVLEVAGWSVLTMSVVDEQLGECGTALSGRTGCSDALSASRFWGWVFVLAGIAASAITIRQVWRLTAQTVDT